MTLDALEPTSTVLPNGLRVVIATMPSVHQVVVNAHLRVGARHESPDDNGLSHFLEHMLFRGIPSHPTAHAQALAFEELGTTLNASTGSDSGALSMSSPPESLALSFPLFARVFSQPIFSGLDVEKSIVREEILEDLDEHGAQVDPDVLLQEMAFPEHSLGLPITGTVQHLDRFDEAALRHHHGAFYRAKNTVLTVAGPVNAAETLELIRSSFGPMASGARASVTPPAPPAGPAFRFVRHSSSQTEVRVGFRSVGLGSKKEPAIDLVRRLLDDGMATRLYRRICDEKGLCYDVAASHESYEDAGLFTLEADTQHDRAVDVLDEMLDIVRGLRDDGPTQGEIDKAKSRHRWQLRELLDDPEETAEFFGEAAVQSNETTPGERRDRIDSVTPAELVDAAHELFSPANLSVVAVGLLPRKARDRFAERVQSFSRAAPAPPSFTDRPAPAQRTTLAALERRWPASSAAKPLGRR